MRSSAERWKLAVSLSRHPDPKQKVDSHRAQFPPGRMRSHDWQLPMVAQLNAR